TIDIAVAFELGAIRPGAIQGAAAVNNRMLAGRPAHDFRALHPFLYPCITSAIEMGALGRIAHEPAAGKPDDEIGRYESTCRIGIGNHQYPQVFRHDLCRITVRIDYRSAV